MYSRECGSAINCATSEPQGDPDRLRGSAGRGAQKFTVSVDSFGSVITSWSLSRSSLGPALSQLAVTNFSAREARSLPSSRNFPLARADDADEAPSSRYERSPGTTPRRNSLASLVLPLLLPLLFRRLYLCAAPRRAV